MMRRLLSPLLALFCCTLAPGVQAQTQNGRLTPVDLELVLAVDVSSSVDPQEFQLQMKGLADAFRNPQVLNAIELAGSQGIAVAMIQWSDWVNQDLTVDWTLVRNPESAAAFADKIDRAGRFGDGGSTGIAGAIQFATHLIEVNKFGAPRQAIDISGDGAANQGAQPSFFRDLAVAEGITVNGLAILNDNAQLDNYYLKNVIGGFAAFVIRADDYYDFAEAIVRKLVREIAGPPLAHLPSTDPKRPILAGQPVNDARWLQSNRPGSDLDVVAVDAMIANRP
jgi:hypothetical protein